MSVFTLRFEILPNRPISQIPQCNRSISHNAPIKTEKAHFYLNVASWDMEQVHCGICELGQLAPCVTLEEY